MVLSSTIHFRFSHLIFGMKINFCMGVFLNTKMCPQIREGINISVNKYKLYSLLTVRNILTGLDEIWTRVTFFFELLRFQ